MIYLIWGILNLGLLIYFLMICFNAIKLIRQKIGLLATIVFVIGLLSFCRSSDDNNNKDLNQEKTWNFAYSDSLVQSPEPLLEISLEKTLTIEYQLEVIYSRNKQNINVPQSAFLVTNGFICGTNWIPKSISVYKTNDNNKFQYHVYGIVEWKLLGGTVYTQKKEYNGYALINKPPTAHSAPARIASRGKSRI